MEELFKKHQNRIDLDAGAGGQNAAPLFNGGYR